MVVLLGALGLPGFLLRGLITSVTIIRIYSKEYGFLILEALNKNTQLLAQVAPLHFPMYTVSVELLLKMTAVEPHEKLKARLGQRNRSKLLTSWLRTKSPRRPEKAGKGLKKTRSFAC